MKLITAVMVTGKPRGVEGLPQMAVECFLNQTYENKELLILNHGSENFSGKNIRDVKIQKGENEHIGALRNRAFALAQGELICVWDDDDCSSPERMTWQAERTPDGKMSMLENIFAKNLLTGETITRHSRVGFGATMLYPRSTPDRYENWVRGSDGWFRSCYLNKIHLDNPPELYTYNFHGGNLTPLAEIIKKELILPPR